MSDNAQPAQRQQVRERRTKLILRRLAHGREAPVLGQLRAVVGEHAEMRLGVPDVDDKQHRRITPVLGRRGAQPDHHRAAQALRRA